MPHLPKEGRYGAPCALAQHDSVSGSLSVTTVLGFAALAQRIPWISWIFAVHLYHPGIRWQVVSGHQRQRPTKIAAELCCHATGGNIGRLGLSFAAEDL